MKNLLLIIELVAVGLLFGSIVNDIKADMNAFELHQLNNAIVTQCTIDSDSHDGLICD